MCSDSQSFTPLFELSSELKCKHTHTHTQAELHWQCQFSVLWLIVPTSVGYRSSVKLSVLSADTKHSPTWTTCEEKHWKWLTESKTSSQGDKRQHGHHWSTAAREFIVYNFISRVCSERWYFYYMLIFEVVLECVLLRGVSNGPLYLKWSVKHKTSCICLNVFSATSCRVIQIPTVSGLGESGIHSRDPDPELDRLPQFSPHLVLERHLLGGRELQQLLSLCHFC